MARLPLEIFHRGLVFHLKYASSLLSSDVLKSTPRLSCKIFRIDGLIANSVSQLTRSKLLLINNPIIEAISLRFHVLDP